MKQSKVFLLTACVSFFSFLSTGYAYTTGAELGGQYGGGISAPATFLRSMHIDQTEHLEFLSVGSLSPGNAFGNFTLGNGVRSRVDRGVGLTSWGPLSGSVVSGNGGTRITLNRTVSMDLQVSTFTADPLRAKRDFMAANFWEGPVIGRRPAPGAYGGATLTSRTSHRRDFADDLPLWCDPVSFIYTPYIPMEISYSFSGTKLITMPNGSQLSILREMSFTFSQAVAMQPVPLPASALLLTPGLLGLIGFRLRANGRQRLAC